MRFIAAIFVFVVAFAAMGYGVAQRTIFAQPDNVTASTQVHSAATVTVIDSKTLRALQGRQKIDIGGPGTVFAAYGRTADVRAWVGKASYNRIGYSPTKRQLTSTLVRGTQRTVPEPRGSDLWLDEYSHAKTLSFSVNVPDGVSVIIASDGTKPAPTDVSIRWPLDNRTPWSGPLIVGGALLLLLGLGLYLWALVHLRRARGPRRKTPKLPRPPKQRSYRPRKKAIEAPITGRRSAARRMAVVPVTLAAALAMTGCSANFWPDLSGASATPRPTASSTAATTADLKPTAVSAPQLKAIVARVATVATQADQDKNVDLLKTRFEGPALDARTANYAVRNADNTVPAVKPAITADDAVKVILPQQTPSWPRTVFTVLQDGKDKTVPPVALMLVQNTARDNYKVEYAVSLEAKATLPDVAPANIGTQQLPPQTPLLALPAEKVALAYGDLLDRGADSPSMKDFDTADDALLPSVGLDARKKMQAALPATAAMTFANSEGPGDNIALHTNDSGAIVAVNLNETVTVKPTQAGAAVNPEGQVKTLSGLSSTTKGTVSVYGDQLLFYVPAAGSKQKITLLGFATDLISAKESS